MKIKPRIISAILMFDNNIENLCKELFFPSEKYPKEFIMLIKMTIVIIRKANIIGRKTIFTSMKIDYDIFVYMKKKYNSNQANIIG